MKLSLEATPFVTNLDDRVQILRRSHSKLLLEVDLDLALLLLHLHCTMSM